MCLILLLRLTALAIPLGATSKLRPRKLFSSAGVFNNSAMALLRLQSRRVASRPEFTIIARGRYMEKVDRIRTTYVITHLDALLYIRGKMLLLLLLLFCRNDN